MLKKFMVGGAALGGGAAATSALVNWLKTMREDASEEQTADDDTIYVNIPAKSNKIAGSLLEPGIAVTGGMLSAGAAAALVQTLSQKLKQRQMQKRLDEAQQVYISELDREAGDDEKVAGEDGRPMSPGEGAFGLASSVPILLALASGALSYGALNKYFPAAAPTKNRRLTPRRIVVREGEEEDKEASFDLTDQDYEDADSFMVRFAHGVVDHSAAHSDLSDIIGAVKAGRAQELNALLDQGLDNTMFEVVKGASTGSSAPMVDSVAYGMLLKSARMGPTVKILAAAELVEHWPKMAAAAFQLRDSARAALVKIAATVERSIREEEYGEPLDEKSAATIQQQPQLTEEDLMMLLAQLQQQGQPQQDSAASTPPEAVAAGASAGDPTTSLDGNPATPLTDGSSNQDVAGEAGVEGQLLPPQEAGSNAEVTPQQLVGAL